MEMIKDGQVKVGTTRCDNCSAPATTTIGRGIYCADCAPKSGEKQAAADENMKNAHDRLANLH